MIHVAVFSNFKFECLFQYYTQDAANAFAHGIARGFRLANGQGPLYVAQLPRDSAEMADVIPADELERVRVALGGAA